MDAETESDQVEPVAQMIFACPKVTKIGYRIEYHEVGDYERPAAHPVIKS